MGPIKKKNNLEKVQNIFEWSQKTHNQVSQLKFFEKSFGVYSKLVSIYKFQISSKKTTSTFSKVS